jgi:chorismate mutase
MTALLEKGIEALRKASQDDQDRADELLLLLAERGEIASDEEVAALKRRHGLS